MAVVEGVNAGIVETAPTSDPEGTGQSSGSGAKATKITTTDAITISEMGWYAKIATVEANFEVGIYSHDSGNDEPQDLLFSETINAKGTDIGWKRRSGLSWELEASTTYWIAVQMDDIATKMDQGGSGVVSLDNGADFAFNDPWQETFGGSVLFTIYALIGAAGTNLQLNIGDVWKTVDATQINIGDVWKDVIEVQQNIGDVWKTVF